MTETSNAITRQKEARLLFLHGFACAQDVWRFGATPVSLAADSLGCRVALEVAALAPELVNGLVLIEASMIGERNAHAARQQIYSLVEKSGFPQFVENRFNEMFLSESPM